MQKKENQNLSKGIKKAIHFIGTLLVSPLYYWYFSIQFVVRKKIHKKRYEELKQFKNKFCGKRIFLIGTGPSLTEQDVWRLKDEYTFSVNSFVLAMKDMKFDPTFYGFIDGQVMDLWGEDVLSIDNSIVFYTSKFPIKKTMKKRLRKKANAYEFLEKDDECWTDFVKGIPKGFSDDVSKEVYWGYTCMYSMMQIISYMGFSEVYLLGMDCIYAPGKRDFRDCRDENTIKMGSYGGETVPKFIKAWEAVERYTRDMDINIYNATRGGMLEVFKRVNLDDVLNNKRR